MFRLAPFDQGRLLQNRLNVPIEAQNGVCVALCDLWLFLMKSEKYRHLSAEQRMEKLASQQGMDYAINYQQQYSYNRHFLGRETGRNVSAAQLGHSFDPDGTVVMKSPFTSDPLSNIKQRLKMDLKTIGSYATWSLRFSGGGGHALAGISNLRSNGPIHTITVNIFDPNIGEYSGDWIEADQILDDILSHFPSLYGQVFEVKRGQGLLT